MRACVKILFIVAMETERLHLHREFGSNATSFEYGCARISIRESGIGMVNAAHATTLAIHRDRPDIVLNTGCAGAHAPALRVGDVVVGTKHVPLSNVVYNDDGTWHYYGSRLDERRTLNAWNANEYLLDVAHSVAEQHNNNSASTAHVGTIGSYDTWSLSRAHVAWMHETLHTMCEDMEAASIAHVCAKYDIPFLSIKDISNSIYAKPRGPNALDSFDPFTHVVPTVAGRTAAAFVRGVVDNVVEESTYASFACLPFYHNDL